MKRRAINVGGGALDCSGGQLQKLHLHMRKVYFHLKLLYILFLRPKAGDKLRCYHFLNKALEPVGCFSYLKQFKILLITTIVKLLFRFETAMQENVIFKRILIKVKHHSSITQWITCMSPCFSNVHFLFKFCSL